MTHGSLFSGIGGFDLAAEWMGWRNAFHCEIDSFCSRILRYHFPDAEDYGDIRTTDFTKWRGKLDVLSGGFPCQPFSVAGRRRGTDDDRYLWPEMLRVIREIRPAWVIGENVAGLLTMVQPCEETEVASDSSIFGEDYTETELRQRHVVETVCEDLEREGYSVQPLVIPACAVGAPHRRDRVWFVAHRADTGAEGVRQYREDRVHAAGASAYTNCNRRRKWTSEQEHFPRVKGKTHDLHGCKNGTVADTNMHRHPPRAAGEGTEGGRREHLPQPGERRDSPQRTDGFSGLPQFAAHTDSKQLQERDARKPCGRQAEDRRAEPSCCITDWEDFPTQPPVCGGDDGFSSRLDGITFPRWRSESVKAYGNAVVPQVAYEIFRAIEMAEKGADNEKRL